MHSAMGLRWHLRLPLLLRMCIISDAFDDIEIWKMTNLAFIIPGHVVQELALLEGKPSSLWEPKDPRECARIQKGICRNVFGTSYFEAVGEHWLDPDIEKVPFPRSLLSSVFSTLGNFNCLSPTGPSELLGYHRYKRLRNELEERSVNFTCDVEATATGEIRKYSISKPYYISVEGYNLVHIGGRFIYRGDLVIDELVAFAADSSKVREIFKKGENGRFEFEDLVKMRNAAGG